MESAGWRQEGKDLLRAVAIGTIFGMPLLYTMEVWEHGATFSSLQLLLILCASLVFNFLYSVVWGIREDHSWLGAFADAVTSVGISVLLATLILALTNEISFTSEVHGSLGKIILESIVISIGVSFTTAHFEGRKDEKQEKKDAEEMSREELVRCQAKDDLRDVDGSFAGATIFAFNVAPTEEILLIASKLSTVNLLLIVLANVVFCYVILFASGLWEREVFVPDSLFQKPAAEVVMVMAIALLVSGFLLFAMGFQGTTSSLDTFVSCVVALSLPASVGAAAGRLVV